MHGGRAAETAGAVGLVADGQIQGALLVDAVLADGVHDVEQLVVLGHPAVGLGKAGRHVVHAVGGRQGQLAVIKDVGALAVVHELVVHGDATAHLGLVGGPLAVAKVVPGVVGDVKGTARRVNLQEGQAAALVGQLDADVVAVNAHGPVGHTVGVDLAARNADGRRVLGVGGHAAGAGAAEEVAGRGLNDGSRGGKDGGNVGIHFEGIGVRCVQKNV